MARDGIAPFHVAQQLMKKDEYKEKFPMITEDRISLVYLSRKVMHTSFLSDEGKILAKDYLKQEISQKSNPKGFIFVDIGFRGSTIEMIRTLMLESHPNKSVEFDYLISHTPNAAGFLGNLESPLEDIESAGLNPAVHWLEDSHQGIEKSPKNLVRTDKGISPDTLNQGLTCTKDPLQKLLRQFASEKCVEGAVELDIPENQEIKKSQEDHFKANFVETLKKIKQRSLPIFIEHS